MTGEQELFHIGEDLYQKEEKGYIFDALVLDDSNFYVDQENLTIEERLERIIHLGDDRNIVQRYVSGKKY